jgi:glycosyltransferase involved in cell wall biosynthesis
MTEYKSIAIDCRMVNASGIGTCIQGWVPRLITSRPDTAFILLGDTRQLAMFAWSRAPNVTVRLFCAPIYSLREQWDWLKLRSENFGLVWVPHYNIPLFWPGPLFVTVHDVGHLAMPDVFGRVKRAYARLFFGQVRDRATCVSFVSNFSRDEFLRLVGDPKGRSAVVYNGIDEAWFAPLPDIRIPPDIGDLPYIVCVGNVKPHKNISRLIEAFGLITAQIPHRLVIVGKRDGFITGDPEAARLAEPLGDRVKFTGYLSDELLRLVIGKAELLVHPSRYEGFGLPPLEAMACGCPVAIAAAGSMPEISGDAALYFDPTDVADISEKILTMCLDFKKKQDFIARGLVQAKRYNWDDQSKKLIALMF